MPFKKFTGRHRYHTHDAWVTIQRRGTFGMNKAAAELLDTPDYIELYFDDDTQRMGIGVGESDSPSAYRLRKQDSDSWLFSGAAFCQFYRIDTGTTRRYAVQMDGELLVLDFNSEPMVVKSRREAANGQAEAA